MSKQRRKNQQDKKDKELLNKIGSFEKFVFPMIRVTYPKLVASDIVTQPRILKGTWTVDMANSIDYHPYPEKIATFKHSIRAKTFEEYVQDWDEPIKNALYGYILTNPFNYPNEVEFSYAYVFSAALGVKSYVASSNKFQITREDVIRHIENSSSYGKNDLEANENHIWKILRALLDQNLL